MIYQVKIGQGAQPYINCDDPALFDLARRHGMSGRTHGYHYGNGGIRRFRSEFDWDGFRADLKAQGVRTRKIKDGIKVIPPVEIVEAVAQLEAVWQKMAQAGRTDWDKMRAEIYDAADRYGLLDLIRD